MIWKAGDRAFIHNPGERFHGTPVTLTSGPINHPEGQYVTVEERLCPDITGVFIQYLRPIPPDPIEDAGRRKASWDDSDCAWRPKELVKL